MTHLHPKCQTACRRGRDVTPCDEPGGCLSSWSPRCVLCQAQLDHGHACQVCVAKIGANLDDIGRFVTDAAAYVPVKGSGEGSRPAPASRPPLNLDALDPELVAVVLVDGDESTRMPVLNVLEDWERIIRDDQGFAPYGLATEMAMDAAGARGDSWWVSTIVTFPRVLEFLRKQLHLAAADPTFDLQEFARQVRLCRRALARWDADRERGGWRVPCPTITDDGECGRPLKVQPGADEVACRSCGVARNIEQLLRVAGADADVWVDIEAAARLAGVAERTVRRWIRRGAVAKRGAYVRVLDVRRHAEDLSA